MDVRYVDLADATPDDAVVVVDVLRAFTTEAWAYHRGAARILAVDTPEQAFALRDEQLPSAVLVGEEGGRRVPGFDFGNSPSELASAALAERPVLHRTAAGTQGLVRCAASPLLVAASFVTAAATARYLAAAEPGRTTFVITGASLGRDGDEDLACAELIAARLAGHDPDPARFTARVAVSDAGRAFGPDGPDWAPPADLVLACEVDRFEHALVAAPADGLDAVEVVAVLADSARHPGR